MDYKLSEESAKMVLQQFLDYYEIDREDMPEDQAQAFDVACGKVIKAIRMGRLEVMESGAGLVVKQHLRNPPKDVDVIEYTEISGKAKLAMKNKTNTDNYGKIYSLMGSLSGLGETAIVGLKAVDLSLVECLGVLFLAV